MVSGVKSIAKHSPNEYHPLRFDDFEVNDDCLIGEEGNGFREILFGMNAERILLAAESLGTGKRFTLL